MLVTGRVTLKHWHYLWKKWKQSAPTLGYFFWNTFYIFTYRCISLPVTTTCTPTCVSISQTVCKRYSHRSLCRPGASSLDGLLLSKVINEDKKLKRNSERYSVLQHFVRTWTQKKEWKRLVNDYGCSIYIPSGVGHHPNRRRWRATTMCMCNFNAYRIFISNRFVFGLWLLLYFCILTNNKKVYKHLDENCLRKPFACAIIEHRMIPTHFCSFLIEQNFQQWGDERGNNLV